MHNRIDGWFRVSEASVCFCFCDYPPSLSLHSLTLEEGALVINGEIECTASAVVFDLVYCYYGRRKRGGTRMRDLRNSGNETKST